MNGACQKSHLLKKEVYADECYIKTQIFWKIPATGGTNKNMSRWKSWLLVKFWSLWNKLIGVGLTPTLSHASHYFLAEISLSNSKYILENTGRFDMFLETSTSWNLHPMSEIDWWNSNQIVKSKAQNTIQSNFEGMFS